MLNLKGYKLPRALNSFSLPILQNPYAHEVQFANSSHSIVTLGEAIQTQVSQDKHASITDSQQTIVPSNT